jgi:DNA-binding transcriptional ArsR family regulator
LQAFLFWADLSVRLNVSEDTVRRDLNELTDSGQIIKVHEGAISKNFHFPYGEREVYKKDETHEGRHRTEIGAEHAHDLDDDPAGKSELTNSKLHKRGIKMIVRETGIDEPTAERLLKQHGSVRKAIEVCKPK